MATYNDDESADYATLPYKSSLVKRKPIKCPVCQGKVVPIIYGEPSIELAEKTGQGEIVLGGCIITDHPATWACNKCKTEFVKISG